MIKLILNILIRALKTGIVYDKNIAEDVANLPDGYVIKLNILPKNLSIMFRTENQKIVAMENGSPDLLVEFKDQKTAVKVLLGKTSVATAFCEHRIKVHGNINNAMALTRIINTLECYLFPKFVVSKLFVPLPHLEVSKFKFYFKLLFGDKL